MSEYMYGIREDGSIVSINDIGYTETGLRCKCKCPQCRRDLQACSLLDNNKKSRYFRHHNEGYNRDGIDNLNGCTATSANESGLHMMAKELLAEAQKIVFPAMNIDLGRLDLQYDADILSGLPQNVSLQNEFVFDYSEVAEIEKPYPGFRPDVSVTGNGNTFLIEIAVTHKVGVDKQKKVEEYGLPMLEIDLSDYVEVGITRESLRKILSEETKHKRWISFPADLINGALRDLSAQAERIRKQREEEERKRAEQAKQRAEYFAPDIYASTLRVNREDFAFERYAKRELHFEANRSNYPFFIDIPISGEIVFRCDRRMWQGKIFDRWVFNRTGDAINIWDIWKKLIQQHNLPINTTLNEKFVYPGVDEPTYLPYAVIRKYFEYLERLGFVEVNGKWAKVLEKHSITPPDQKYASLFKTAICQTDGYSPLSTDLIDQKVEALQKAEQDRLAEMQRKRDEELRQHEEEQRKAAQEVEDKRRREEAAKQAAENAKRQEDEDIRREMQLADYEQNDHIVHDRKGRRWIKCKFCKKAVLFNENELSAYDSMRKNIGTCYSCRFKR